MKRWIDKIRNNFSSHQQDMDDEELLKRIGVIVTKEYFTSRSFRRKLKGTQTGKILNYITDEGKR